MSANIVQTGDTLTLPAPRTLTAGLGAKVGQIFGVACNDVTSGDDGEFDVEGVFDLVKVGSQAWATKGLHIYWDDTNHRCTTTSSGNLLIGVNTKITGAGAGETTGRVRLNGSF